MKCIFQVMLLALSIVCGLLALPAQADFIIWNTGPGYNWTLFNASGGSQSGFASEFESNATVITSIKAYLENDGTSVESLTYSIYSGGGSVPSGTPLYATTVAGPPVSASYAPIWWGPTVNWSLTSGSDYWVVVTNNSSTSLAIGTFASDNPLVKDATLGYIQLNQWAPVPLWDVAWQLEGNNPNNPVPIPAAFWFLGSGLIGLIGVRRFWK